MDSDAKELGHERAAKDRFAYLGESVVVHSCVGNRTPIEDFQWPSRQFAFAIDPHESAIE